MPSSLLDSQLAALEVDGGSQIYGEPLPRLKLLNLTKHCSKCSTQYMLRQGTGKLAKPLLYATAGAMEPNEIVEAVIRERS